MDIPRPFKGENEFTYSRRVGRGSIPSGAGQHYDRIRMPHPKPKQSELRRAVIDLVTGCKGDKGEVIRLGRELVHQALAEGKKDEARRILAAVSLYVKG